MVHMMGLPRWLSSKEPAHNTGDVCSLPGSGGTPGEGSGNPLQHLAGEIPWTEAAGGPQSMGRRVGTSLVTRQQ